MRNRASRQGRGANREFKNYQQTGHWPWSGKGGPDTLNSFVSRGAVLFPGHSGTGGRGCQPRLLSQLSHLGAGASRWPVPPAGSSQSPRKVAWSRDCGVDTFYGGNHGGGNFLCATCSLCDPGHVFWPLSKPHSLASKMLRLGRIVSIPEGYQCRLSSVRLESSTGEFRATHGFKLFVLFVWCFFF